jgi:glycosyltransferase involved in cell wall biosynthesis
MRIGLIAPPWLPVPPPKYGGTEAVVDRLARGLLARGHDVLLYTTGDSTCPVPKLWVYEQAQRDQLGQVVVELRHLVRAYDALRDCDIVHDHTVAGPVYSMRYPELPVVMTAHGPFSDGLEDIYGAVADRVPLIAISHHQASTAHIPARAVIHHGIDPEAFPVGTGQGGYYCYMGRMAPYKGAREAVLIAREAGVRLLLAAKMDEPAEHEYFHDEVEPLLGDGIDYLGEIGGQERLDLLGNAVALLNPISWDEPFGLVMVEALACGTPVLAFPRGAAPEIVDDGVTGLLCQDVEDAVRRLPELAGLRRAACRQRAETDFSTARMVDKHLALYADVIANSVNLLRRPRVLQLPAEALAVDAPARQSDQGH